MFHRAIQPRLTRLLAEAPVVVLTGGRQVGKSTLAQHLIDTGVFPGRYVSLDDLTVLGAARSDPMGFIAALEGPIVIDEVQRAPDLLLAIKIAVDRDRAPGRFLLTGSANFLFLPSVADALVGRMRHASLWPLSASEILAQETTLVDDLFAGALLAATPCWQCGSSLASGTRCRHGCERPGADLRALLSRIVRGGFPEVVDSGIDDRQRGDWFQSYADALIQRNLRDLAGIDALPELLRLARLLAARTSSTMSYSALARDLCVSQPTAKRWVELFRQIYLVQVLPPWSRNLGKRLVKSPKLHVTDSGLLAHLVGANEARLQSDGRLLGALLESFVAMELTRLAEWSETRPSLYHYRTHDQHEVDVIMENRTGEIVAIEVKASATVTPRDLKGLRQLHDSLGEDFSAGIVLYLGDSIVSFAPKFHAVPLSALWSAPGRAPPDSDEHDHVP